ncbi:MAG: hypothetical protein V8Q43_03945 [Christensenellaceae bacterium]
MEQILQQAKRAKQASEELALWGAAAKQRLLEAMAAALEAGAEDILRANRQDLARRRPRARTGVSRPVGARPGAHCGHGGGAAAGGDAP